MDIFQVQVILNENMAKPDSQEYKVTCAFLPQENIQELSKINTLNLVKRQYLPHFLSDKDFKGTVMNRILQSFYGGLLEIRLTVPLIKIIRVCNL